jgi:hypothetical protein
LDLVGATILTDQALKSISRISTLRHLSLERNYQVTDEGVAQLGVLHDLKYFRANNLQRVTANALLRMFEHRDTIGATPIKRLDLSKTAVSDAALEIVARQSGLELESLSISRMGPFGDGTQASDDGFLKIVHSCKNLKHLDVSYCNFLTGKSIAPLVENMSNLLSINLTGCRGIPVTSLGLMGDLRRKFGRLRWVLKVSRGTRTDADLIVCLPLDSCLTIGDTPGLSDELLAEITRNGALLGWHKSAVEEPLLRSTMGVGDSWE